MKKCGNEYLSEHDTNIALRVRINLYKISQEILYGTHEDPAHMKSVIPTIVNDLAGISAAIESIENPHIKHVLQSWYMQVHDLFFQSDNVQAYLWNQMNPAPSNAS